jgi:hypothetical protein
LLETYDREAPERAPLAFFTGYRFRGGERPPLDALGLCDIERDTRCVGAAPELCEACAAPRDLGGNGTTGPSDLVILLYGSSRRKRRRGTERAL